MVIGVANAIPGVSGGTMAVSMGIYDKLIHALTHLFKEFKKSMQVIVPILIGAGLGVVVLAAVIEKMFEAIPIQTNMLFIGLIIGGLPIILNKVKGQKVSAGGVIGFLVFFVIVVGLAAIGESEGAAADVSFGFVNVLKLFGVGIVAAATMVIPGVSGSMMLMIMGYYETIIEVINDFVKSIIAFDIDAMLTAMGVLVPFGIGAVFGIFAIAKLVEIVFEKAPLIAYWSIIGLIVSSPIGIILMNKTAFVEGLNPISIITGLVALVAGGLVALKLGGE
ncbi:MAG: DUF368 domain-containing protein [Lachnospiraceae bacterium]|nr:DUF368 domain-containing protein [Lachnospiraceae bacterium]